MVECRIINVGRDRNSCGFVISCFATERSECFNFLYIPLFDPPCMLCDLHTGILAKHGDEDTPEERKKITSKKRLEKEKTFPVRLTIPSLSLSSFPSRPPPPPFGQLCR